MRPQAQDQSLDRLPPNSGEYERATLGAVLLDATTAYPIVAGLLRDDLEAFYDLRNRTIWELISRMIQNESPVNLISIQGQLRLDGQLDQIGGLVYLSELENACPSPAGVAYFAEELVELHRRRKLIAAHTDAVSRIYEGAGSQEIIEDISRSMADLAAPQAQGQANMRELVQEALTEIERCHEAQGQISGISTGFTDLDKMTDGLHAGEMLVIAARPSIGKTSLAMNIAEHVAVDQGLPVGVFSLEMTAQSLVLRMLCSRARVNLRNIRHGYLSERDFPKITGAAGKLTNAPLFIDDASGITIFELKMRAIQMQKKHGIRLWVIDYLQLLGASGRKNMSRENEVAAMSGGCKNLAKETGCPVIVLSQLNRVLEKEKNRKPKLSDLRETGAIEQDADVVGMLYHPASKDDEDESEDQSTDAVPVNLFLAKQRNGPTGDVPLTFLKGYTRFESAAKVSSGDVPSGYQDQPRSKDY